MTEADPSASAGHLARAVLSGEPDALGRWFEHEQRAVWKLCFGFLADPHGADDALQDAMLRLHEGLETWDTTRPYRGWRNTVVLNLCRDRLRRASARHAAETRAAEGGLPHRLPDPDVAACQAEVRDALLAALVRLAQREREAFILVEFEGFAAHEAAQTLGVGPSTVRSLLTLARSRLREILRARVPGLCPDSAGSGR